MSIGKLNLDRRAIVLTKLNGNLNYCNYTIYDKETMNIERIFGMTFEQAIELRNQRR